MIVGATIGAADDLHRNEEEFWVIDMLELDISCSYHDTEVFVPDAVVVYGRLQEMRVLF